MSAVLLPLSRPLLELAIGTERNALARKLSNLARAVSFAHSVAMFDGPVFCGAGGVIPHWHGRAEAWLLITREASKRQIVKGVRLAARWFDRVQEDPDFARLEIYVRADASYAEAFTRALGFGNPLLLERWGPDGADYILFARLKGESKCGLQQ